MEKFKKAILLISGPGVILFEAVALFVHLFTSTNTKSLIIAGLIVFFVVFVPLYSIEYFKQNFKNPKKENIRLKKRNTRTQWVGGNIHGKTPAEVN